MEIHAEVESFSAPFAPLRFTLNVHDTHKGTFWNCKIRENLNEQAEKVEATQKNETKAEYKGKDSGEKPPTDNNYDDDDD